MVPVGKRVEGAVHHALGVPAGKAAVLGGFRVFLVVCAGIGQYRSQLADVLGSRVTINVKAPVIHVLPVVRCRDIAPAVACVQRAYVMHCSDLGYLSHDFFKFPGLDVRDVHIYAASKLTEFLLQHPGRQMLARLRKLGFVVAKGSLDHEVCHAHSAQALP